ncbi:uncharacterized protein PHACADRAFT_248957 [Phanerochaete carnosa HHB-10118-sp]|uniref:Uncharacterized protein n=1 Tax=Phanerochaete carnosa (strain HHB-10118-sp) TaxID=650164 RepID=K5W4Q2_PHACS|nr:uncharacterized protein PHACADRAFT_248957 [Phanerochaete carnosa HHB-10118-sp]EKM58858.1 hypothetical protein PHACADRAFT_248957 [Phanerochaete carnosa HHB-10118-sp]
MIIRQYRHLGMRVLVSTQEPTVVPAKLLALCSFIVAHRFQSPGWLRALMRHVTVPELSLDALFAKVRACCFVLSPLFLVEEFSGR